jgi:hypothetical protein
VGADGQSHFVDPQGAFRWRPESRWCKSSISSWKQAEHEGPSWPASRTGTPRLLASSGRSRGLPLRPGEVGGRAPLRRADGWPRGAKRSRAGLRLLGLLGEGRRRRGMRGRAVGEDGGAGVRRRIPAALSHREALDAPLLSLLAWAPLPASWAPRPRFASMACREVARPLP